MARQGTYPLLGTLDVTTQLFSSCRLGTAVRRVLDHLYAQLASPLVSFFVAHRVMAKPCRTGPHCCPWGACQKRASSL